MKQEIFWMRSWKMQSLWKAEIFMEAISFHVRQVKMIAIEKVKRQFKFSGCNVFHADFQSQLCLSSKSSLQALPNIFPPPDCTVWNRFTLSLKVFCKSLKIFPQYFFLRSVPNRFSLSTLFEGAVGREIKENCPFSRTHPGPRGLSSLIFSDIQVVCYILNFLCHWIIISSSFHVDRW